MHYILWLLAFIIIALLVFFFVGSAKPARKIAWGVNFSDGEATFLKLDPRENYLAILDDLKAKNIKLAIDWDTIEDAKGVYQFDDLDWQVKQAEDHDAKLIMAIGMKTPRWPECHIPQWGINLGESEQQQEILNMLTEVVTRYKDSSAVYAWQVENEPLLSFGYCPWIDKNFLKKEVALVKKLDPNHPVIVTDSGELSFWLRVGDTGADIIGVTTYEMVWQEYLKMYISYIYPPVFYHRRAELVNWLFKKPVIGVELQAEPWCAKSIMNTSLEEQAKTMNLKQFQKNVRFARDTGMDRFYFWGAEWWYWMKTQHNDSSIWDEAKKVINE